MRDFELVLVDTLYPFRSHLVEEYAREQGVDDKLIHIPPPEGCKLPSRHVVPAINQGVSKSTGELLVLWSDFCYPYSQSLQRHWDIYAGSARRATTTGSYDYVSCPPLNKDLASRARRMTMKEYLSLVETRADEFGITIFSKAFEESEVDQLRISNTLLERHYGLEIDYRRVSVGELAPWYVWFSKNSSFPRDLFLEAGGLDNDLGGWHDEFDLGMRLARLGHRMVYDPKNRVRITNLIDLFPRTTPVKTKAASYSVWVEKRIGHGLIKFKPRVPPGDVLKLRLRLLLESPKVVRLLRKVGLERLALMVIYTFSLGEPELRYDGSRISVTVAS